ncbi:aminoglycoside adenylyltransferase domain-containing protein [Dethiothermospora halolimnae]|uniref:nucleotidyltransferase domain-containing protein n=1 Tax=Dethiothermospora halolimnae TaxID=3114390 RepID=UPI003CCC073D
MKNQLEMYDEVNNIIKLLLKKIKKVLQHEFVGMYIHGSIAMGDFNIDTSDIDFFVITEDIISRQRFVDLEKMHKDIISNCCEWANRLEGSYVPKKNLLSKSPPYISRPYFNNGKLILAPHGYEWILELYTIREYGVIIDGPNPKSLIDTISSKDLQRSSLKILNNWWKPMLADSSYLENGEYQVYAILTMCRIMYMFTYGNIVSKKEAAKWVQKEGNSRWEGLIEQAFLWKRGYDFNKTNETKDFIRYIIEFTKDSFR